MPKNWRPISLLNTDYKLASTIITERPKKVMDSIVHADQTRGVVGCSIFSNLHLVRDLLDMIDKTDECGILVTLDQEKAFDRVDHAFLMGVLTRFGFGPSFRRWVSIFYSNVFSRIICNGRLTDPIFLERGVRQGCPLSPLLYVLVSEVLSTQIRVSGLKCYRDEFGRCKWHYLARYFLGTRLAKLDKCLDFSSNVVPLSGTPSNFYRTCLGILTSIHTKHGSLPDDFSCKNIYNLLLELPAVSPRSAGFWVSAVGRPINRWASVWRKSRLKLVENKKSDLIWLILHRAVKVRYSLKVWGYKVRSDKCALCSKPETIKHCFLVCPRLRRVWGFFAPFLTRLEGSTFSLSVSSVLHPFSDSQSSARVSLSCYLKATVLYWMWHARNLATFRNAVLSSAKIVANIKRDISLGILASRRDEQANFWALDNILCLLRDKSISFFS